MGVSDRFDTLVKLYADTTKRHNTYNVYDYGIKDVKTALRDSVRTIQDGEDSNGSIWEDLPLNMEVKVSGNDLISVFVDVASDVYAHVYTATNYIHGYEFKNDPQPVVDHISKRALSMLQAIVIVERYTNTAIKDPSLICAADTNNQILQTAFCCDKLVFVLEGKAPRMKQSTQQKRQGKTLRPTPKQQESNDYKAFLKSQVDNAVVVLKANLDLLKATCERLIRQNGFQHTEVYCVVGETEGEVNACYMADPDCDIVGGNSSVCSCIKTRYVMSYDNDSVLCASMSDRLPREHAYSIKAVGLRRLMDKSYGGKRKHSEEPAMQQKPNYYQFILRPQSMWETLWAFWLLRGCDYLPPLYTGKGINDIVEASLKYFNFEQNADNDDDVDQESFDKTSLSLFFENYAKPKVSVHRKDLLTLIKNKWVKDATWLKQYWSGDRTVDVDKMRLTPLVLSDLVEKEMQN